MLIQAFLFRENIPDVKGVFQVENDSNKKKYNLLHFCRISVLIELILAGKAKLSMASCLLIFSRFSNISKSSLLQKLFQLLQKIEIGCWPDLPT